jgi:AcrR family transcriptional regulator
MNRRTSNVNKDRGSGAEPGKRPYDARGRQERAARVRAVVIETAERRFVRDGYAETTVSQIAADAGVSDHTIYKSFGGKPGLVRAIRAKALLGGGPTPAEDRSDAVMAEESDPRRVIAAWGTLTAEVMPRVAPLLLLIRDAAATDPEVTELLDEMDADRLRRMTDNARRLVEGGRLEAGLTVEDVADVLWTYSAPELYELLVIRRGWSAGRYGTFIAAAMTAALVGPIA